VLDSRLARPLVDPENEFYGLAVHTLCHETAHVYDHFLQSEAFPGFYGTRLNDLREATFTELALSAWDEYIASRLSAPWGTEGYCRQYEEVLCEMYRLAVIRANEARARFASHKNVGATLSELSAIFGGLFTRASYLVGHLDGLGKDLDHEAPELAKLLSETTWLSPLWDEYLSVLRSMFGSFGTWPGLTVLEPLKLLFEKLLRGGGVGFVKLPNGNYYVGFSRTSSL
jgi:hypothetical protein